MSDLARCICGVACVSFGIAVVQAQKSDSPAPAVENTCEALFHAGRYEATFTSGPMFSPFLATQNRPTINYTLSEFQLGYMLTDVKHSGWFRGNFQIAGEGFAGGVFEGEGGYVSGLTVWLRYNFVPKDWRVVPYAQAGMGLTFTDIDRNMVGETFNFNLDLGVGARCFIAHNWSVNLEYRYQHISNANIGRRNVGINAHGPMLGLSYFF